MMKKIFYFLFLSAFGVLILSSCSDDDPLPKPNFTSVTVNGTAITESVSIPISEEPITLRVLVENVQVAGYVWMVGEDVIEGATGSTYQLVPTHTGSYVFTVTARNQDGVAASVTFTVNITGTYKNGIFFYGTTYEDLAFFEPTTSTFHEGNIYKNVNGHMVGVNSMSGGINDIYIYNNKLYMLTPKDYDSEGAKISVCDAQTLKEQKAITAEGFDMSSLGYIYNMIPVNENKFYIGYNPISNISGIRVLNVNGDGTTAFSSEDIPGTGGKLGVDGPATFARMLKNGEDVLAACGSKIQVINSSDQVTKSIEIDLDKQIADIVKGKDGKIYAVVTGATDKSSSMWPWMPTYTSSASIVTIDPSTYTVTASKTLLDGETRLDIRAGLEANGAVASLTSDEIFFVVGMAYSPAKIYSYNYSNGTISLVMNQAGMSGSCGKYMATDKEGMLYIPLIKTYNSCHTSVYRISDKQRMADIEAKIGVVKGDGGYISTYLFE
ncbi:MAG: DUF5074 domain-containing protein [Prevotellaceae bacterium]|jgi:hypothetical protein|nr:DUF5074 domain-containing protein [Prevotellaceae bacterium]